MFESLTLQDVLMVALIAALFFITMITLRLYILYKDAQSELVVQRGRTYELTFGRHPDDEQVAAAEEEARPEAEVGKSGTFADLCEDAGDGKGAGDPDSTGRDS